MASGRSTSLRAPPSAVLELGRALEDVVPEERRFRREEVPPSDDAAELDESLVEQLRSLGHVE